MSSHARAGEWIQPFTLRPTPTSSRSHEDCAIPIIDAHRDFLEPGGFGKMLGYDVSQLRRTIEPSRGYHCLVLEDCVGFYFPEFHDMGLAGWKRAR